MAEAATFSASGEDAITKTIRLEQDNIPVQLPLEEFEEYYDIDRTVDEILAGNYRRIALQFPDELLRDSVPIFRRLKARLGDGRELYVLADTSYGSCCVDEVAAQHVDADAVVHYGHACMSQTSRLPVIYVFGKKEIDSSDCVTRLLDSMNASASTSDIDKRAIMLRYDVAYAHQADAILEKLRGALSPSTRILYTPIPLVSRPRRIQSESDLSNPSALHAQSQPGEGVTGVTADGASIDDSLADYVILYIGGESLGLTNILMTHASCEVHSYDPKTKTARLESVRTNKLLMRRYAVVQKARDADVFGILIGTLGVASYLPLISHLRTLLSRAQKKSYTISVGKLNPAKLANFLEIECFVLVACPENSLIDAKDFLRPIITPYELEVALRAEQSWTGRYVLDFDKVLSQSREHTSEDDSEAVHEDLDQPIFSLVTGQYRHAKRYGDQATPDGNAQQTSAMIVRNQDNAVATLSDSAAGQFLQSRSFQGLEPRVGQDAPSVLEQGRSGIARGYQDDHSR